MSERKQPEDDLSESCVITDYWGGKIDNIQISLPSKRETSFSLK